MTTFFIVSGIIATIIFLIVLKLRTMPKYKISKEETDDSQEKWFVKVRKGLSYYYLEQIKDSPGFENDIFNKSKYPVGGQENQRLAEKVIINHRMTTVSGIEIEGQ